jgi:hypothetical protein
MYHSLQQLEVARGLARERPRQPHAATASLPSSRRILRLLSGGTPRPTRPRQRYA